MSVVFSIPFAVVAGTSVILAAPKWRRWWLSHPWDFRAIVILGALFIAASWSEALCGSKMGMGTLRWTEDGLLTRFTFKESEVAATQPVAATEAQASASAHEIGYSFDLPKTNPAAAAALQRILPARLRSVEWVYELEGTGRPMQQGLLQNKEYIRGWICKPHDCGVNQFYFLVAADGSRATAALQSADLTNGTVQFFGQPSLQERRILLKQEELE